MQMLNVVALFVQLINFSRKYYYFYLWNFGFGVSILTLQFNPQDADSDSEECETLCSVDETSSRDIEPGYQSKTDLLKALAILLADLTGTVAINHSFVAASQVSFLN